MNHRGHHRPVSTKHSRRRPSPCSSSSSRIMIRHLHQPPPANKATASWTVLLLLFLASVVVVTCTPAVREEDVENQAGGPFLIGTGIYDMTGPAAQINFMGYARSTQTGHGIHLRLRSRAFIISENSVAAATAAAADVSNESGTIRTVEEGRISSVTALGRRVFHPSRDGIVDEANDGIHHRSLRSTLFGKKQKSMAATQNNNFATQADPEKTICFVSIDAGMGSDLLTQRVLDRLKDLMPVQGSSGKTLCHRDNLSISGTHTHSAPAGFLQYTLYQITSLGFSEETMGAFVEGVAQSIFRAYSNLQPGSITASSGLLFDASINRSPTSYLLNPPEEREMYAEEGDTDKNMLLLKFTGDNGDDVGLLTWFAVHGTSMNATNQLVSGDNKGYASYLMEKRFNGPNILPGKGKFVAAFASTNLGDVSPNTKGPRCIDTGLPCDVGTSTCNGRNELCIASGPGKDMLESTEIIGRKQYEHALALLQNATGPLDGSISFRHIFVDMSNRQVKLENGLVGRTCPAALGYSFAAGTTDGPGTFDFTQGTNTSNPFWNMLGGFLSKPTEEQIECQHPKPILLNTGMANEPYDWDPSSVPISVFKVGKLFILNVPSEFTTMSGRRLRRAVARIARDEGIEDPIVTIAGLANSYTHYVATYEEYAGQRYEAASTLYGPYTLAAYIQEFERITSDLLNNRPSTSDEGPPDLSKHQISLLPPVEMDNIRFGKKFGAVSSDALDEYVAGVDKVVVSFHSANPRSNQRIEGTFLTVDMLNADGTWTTKYTDGDWCTQYIWRGGVGGAFLGISYADITWDIPKETVNGHYRICHYGTRKTIIGETLTFLFAAPDVLSYSGFAMPALTLIARISHIAGSSSESLRRHWQNILPSRYKDFMGCSRTFSVKSS